MLEKNKINISTQCTLGMNLFKLTRLQGYEEMSNLFQFEVDLLSNVHPNCAMQLMETEFSIHISTAHHSTRSISGIITSILYEHKKQNSFSYTIILEPAIAILKHQVNCRVFHHVSAQDIATILCKKSPVTFKLSKKYSRAKVLTQYNESNYSFLIKQLIKENISFYFEYKNHGHTLIVCDNDSAFPLINNIKIKTKTYKKSLSSTSISASDFRYQSNALITSTTKTPLNKNIFSHPGRNASHKDQEHHLSSIAMQIEERSNHIEFSSEDWRLKIGVKLRIDGCITTIKKVTHRIIDSTHHNTESLKNNQPSYTNTCIVTQHKYLPPFPQKTNTPPVDGCQIAFVSSNHNDVTNDQLGRVKVTFPWQRSNNQLDSDWIRISQHLAGNPLSTQFTPHSQQKVITKRYHARSNETSIIGALYNARNTPPLSLPKNKSISLIKTYSDDKKIFNSIQFNDNTKKPNILFVTKRQLFIKSKNNITQCVGENLKKTIENKKQLNIKNDSATFSAKEKITLATHGSSITLTPNTIIIQSKKINFVNKKRDRNYFSKRLIVHLASNFKHKPIAHTTIQGEKTTLPPHTDHIYPLHPFKQNGAWNLYYQRNAYTFIENIENAQFNDQQAHPIFIGAHQRKEKASPLLPHSSQIIVLKTQAPPPTSLKDIVHNIKTLSENIVFWMLNEIAQVNNNIPPLISDITTLLTTREKRKFLSDMFYNGKFRVKNIKGQLYVIFNGTPTARRWITGTRYAFGNEKIQVIRLFSCATQHTPEFLKEAINITADENAINFILVESLDFIKYYTDPDQSKEFSDLLASLIDDALKMSLIACLTLAFTLFMSESGWVMLLVAGNLCVTLLSGLLIDKAEHLLGIDEELKALGREADAFLNRHL